MVKVFDARVAADGTAYLVIELIAGKCVETAIVGWGDLLVDEVVRVTRGILEILAVAHEVGVVHCDVKPENVLVMDDGSVKLLDFGVARITGDARRAGVAGAADFMAPEQARGEWSRVDARADVWSVGATFYRLIAGRSLVPRSFRSSPGSSRVVASRASRWLRPSSRRRDFSERYSPSS